MLNPKRVESLVNRIEERRGSRAQEVARTQESRDRIKAIREAFPVVILDFWCDTCKRDFEGRAHKEVKDMETPWPDARYVTHCPDGHTCLRRIVDKHRDGFYYQSIKLQRQRMQMEDAMLQPHDPRFKTVYPQQWRKMQEEAEQQREYDDMIANAGKRKAIRV